jgi:hypothetical protein
MDRPKKHPKVPCCKADLLLLLVMVSVFVVDNVMLVLEIAIHFSLQVVA